MLKIFCNKCGKEIRLAPNYISIYKSHMALYDLDDYTLCDDCRHNLRSWMLNEDIKPRPSLTS